MNSIFFPLINTKENFFIFGCWFLPEKFSFCPKNNGFTRVWGDSSPPGSYAYVADKDLVQWKGSLDCLRMRTFLYNNITDNSSSTLWQDFCIHFCLTECVIYSFLLLDKEEAINIQFLMQSRSRFCQNCNAIIDRAMKMKPQMISNQEQVVKTLLVVCS